jgi:hypothetical protein
MFIFWSVSRLWNGRPTIGYNVSRPDAGAGYGRLICPAKIKINAKKNDDVTELAALAVQTAVSSRPSVCPLICDCYVMFCCHCLSGCALGFLFF